MIEVDFDPTVYLMSSETVDIFSLVFFFFLGLHSVFLVILFYKRSERSFDHAIFFMINLVLSTRQDSFSLGM